MVVGGWVLARLRKRKSVTGEDIINFISQTFDEKYDKIEMSRLMHSLHFSSHRIRGVTARELPEDEIKIIESFLKDLHQIIEGVYTHSQIVSMDQTGFWNCGTVLRSYSPCGG